MSRLLVLLGLALPLPALAVPEAFGHLGYLEDATGAPVSGTHALHFALYADQDGTTGLWSETVEVEVIEGVYKVHLGLTAPLDFEILDNYPLYLGISVDGNVEMVPRNELTSAPYSVYAESAYDLRGGTIDATSVVAASLNAKEMAVDSVMAADAEVDALAAPSVTVGSATLDGGGLSIGGEPFIDASGSFVGTPPLPPDLGCGDHTLVVWDEALMVWTCGSELDPVYASSPAADVTAEDLIAWDQAVEAFHWGNHEDASYRKAELDPIFRNSTAFAIQDTDVGRWNNVSSFVDATNFLLADPDDPIEAPITASDVTAWEAARALAGSAAPGAWQQWDEAFRFASAFEEYDDGTAPVQGITQADIDGWRETSDGVLSIVDPADPPLPNSISADAVQRWNRGVVDEYHNQRTTCLQVLTAFPESPDGYYWLVYPYEGGLQRVYCDMVPGVNEFGSPDGSLGGGWTQLHDDDFTTSEGSWSGGSREVMDEACAGSTPGVQDYVYGGIGTFGASINFQSNPRARLILELVDRPHSQILVKFTVIPVGTWLTPSSIIEDTPEIPNDPLDSDENIVLRLDPDRYCGTVRCYPHFEFAALNTADYDNVDCGAPYSQTLGRHTYTYINGHSWQGQSTIEISSDLRYRDPDTYPWQAPPGYFKLDDVEVWIK